MYTKENLNITMDRTAMDIDFAGVVNASDAAGLIHESAYGFSNRSDGIKNTTDTRFGIASGCKLFTAIGICMLVEQGKLTFETRLKDCLTASFPFFHESITVHHLLTHSSGIPDYFDEAVMDDFSELWDDRPMYKMTSLQDFLPMFQDRQMMFKPGERFHYNNAGYIILGLIIEQQSGLAFTDFIEKHVFQKAGMSESGYFSLDQLPGKTAIGYIDDEEVAEWKTNIYSIPIKGGADGGAFVTAGDMIKCWNALVTYQLLSEETTNVLLTPHMQEDKDEFYGYGIWIKKHADEIVKYHVMGYDPGVSFHAAYYPNSGVRLAVTSNKSIGAYSMMEAFEGSV
ncbi:serine hydrolase domain-containing protein [Virgibacillus oceani]|uniref:Penicillin-binding protein n=1 Tax=Virgibacillus oceani TaxID=1479511 RepID=A0A917M6M3_9BACI|nr:serine hydrolase [Virgibacillus oceani]GGG81285.1 penicillin-binding protein [Virgibacillus oceani]